MAIRFDQIQLSDDGNHLYPYIAGTDGYLAIQTASGLTRIGAGNSSYSHFFTDRSNYYFNAAVSFDGNISAYDGNENLSNWNNIDASAFRSKADTNYYLDPDNTGTSLKAAGTVNASNSNMSSYQLNGTYVMDSSRNLVNIVGITSTGNAVFGNSRTDKVNIYGNLGIGHNNYPKIAYPGQNALWGGSGSTTGQIVIDLPGTLGNYDMMYMEIDIYEYSGDAATKLIVGGHNWNSGGNSNTTTTQWYNVNVQVLGRLTKPIYFGRRNDGSNERRCIAIGETTSTWSYATVHVSKVHGAEFYGTAIDWVGDWNIAQTTSTSYFTKNPTTNFNDGGSQTFETNGIGEANHWFGSTSVRSPIFYDLDDTSYYVDPSGQTRINTINLGSSPGSGVTSGYIAQFRGSLHMTASNINYVNQLHFNDNVRFYDDGNDSYLNFKFGDTSAGGIKMIDGDNNLHGYFYADGDSQIGILDNGGSWAVQVANDNITALKVADVYRLKCTTSEVQTYGILVNDTSVKAPIYYDSNDTNYYLDPANTTTSLKTAGPIITSGVNQFKSVGGTGSAVALELKANSSASNSDYLAKSTIKTMYHTTTSGGANNNSQMIFKVGKGTDAFQHTVLTLDSNLDATFEGDINVGGLRIVGDNDSNDQGTAWIRSNGNYIVINPVDGEHLYLNWDTGASGGSGHVKSAGAMYATQFYDRNDTNYYINPAGDSQMNQIHLADYVRHLGDLDTYFGFNGADQWKLHIGGGDRVIANTSTLTSNLNFKAPIFYDSNDTAYYVNPASTSNLNTLNIASFKLSGITSNNLIGYHDSVFGAKYGTLGVDVNGKIGVAEKEITFSVEGTGWVGRHSNPVKILDAPGADKMIVVQEINMLILYSAPLGIGSSGIARTTDNTAYAVGFFQGSGTNGNFTVTGVMPRNAMQYTTTTNARIVNRDVPVEGTKLYPNKALYWKTTRDASSSFGAYPGAQHIIKVKYRILDVSTEFTSAYANAQNINSSSITSISQAF